MVVGGRTDTPVSGQTFFFFAPVFIPLVILGVPILDTAFAILRRTRSRTSPTTADKDHLHHRLMRLGHGHRRSVFILWGWTALLSGLVLYPAYTHKGDGVAPFGIAALGLALYTLLHPGVREVRRAEHDAAAQAAREARAAQDHQVDEAMASLEDPTPTPRFVDSAHARRHRPGGTFPDYELSDHTGTRRHAVGDPGGPADDRGAEPGRLLPQGPAPARGPGGAVPRDRGRLRQVGDHQHRQPARHQRVPLGHGGPLAVPVRPGSQGAEGPRHRRVHRSPPRPDGAPHRRAGARPGGVLASTTATGSSAARPSRSCARTCGPSTAKVRPDWDLSAPGLREKWDAGDHDGFYPYGKTHAQVFAEQD